MKKFMLAGIAGAALALSACGGGNKDEAGSVEPEGGAISKGNGLATASEVAENKRGKVKCPPKIATPARADGMPVDDIVGVRPGMTYDEAANLVLCDNPMIVVEEETYRGFQIDTRGQKYRKGFNANFAEREKSSQEILQEMQDDHLARSGNAVREDMKPGMTRWYVATVGLPTQERVLHVAREEWYAEGKNPTVDGVAQALIGKYGPPSEDQSDQQWRTLSWKYDLQNRPVTDTSPLFRSCNLAAGPNAGASLSPDCGTIISARDHVPAGQPGAGQFAECRSRQLGDRLPDVGGHRAGLHDVGRGAQAAGAAGRDQELHGSQALRSAA